MNYTPNISHRQLDRHTTLLAETRLLWGKGTKISNSAVNMLIYSGHMHSQERMGCEYYTKKPVYSAYLTCLFPLGIIFMGIGTKKGGIARYEDNCREKRL